MSTIEHDQSDNPFIEGSIDDSNVDEGALRITFLEKGWPECPTIRIQVRTTTGKLFQGPEFPLSKLGFITTAAFDLLGDRLVKSEIK